MSDMIWEGKTIEGAIEAALKKLDLQRDQVDVDVIQEPAKGIFGLTKMAKVKVTPKPGMEPKPAAPKPVVPVHEERPVRTERPPREPRGPITPEATRHGQEVLETILKLMGINQYEVKSRVEEDSVILDIKSEAEGLLIGRHGNTREALQYLVDRISNGNEKEKVKFIVDIGGYLNRHKETLEKLAERAVKQVMESQRETHLESMSAFDRRIIHLYLRDHADVKTFSQGEGGLRHIVVAPKNQADEVNAS